jgi:hypothetical protein
MFDGLAPRPVRSGSGRRTVRFGVAVAALIAVLNRGIAVALFVAGAIGVVGESSTDRVAPVVGGIPLLFTGVMSAGAVWLMARGAAAAVKGSTLRGAFALFNASARHLCAR